MNLSPASIFQTAAWAALVALFAGYAIAEDSIGALVIAVAALPVLAHAASHITERTPNDVRDRLAPHQL